MENYCRFCAKKKDNLININENRKKLGDWFIEVLNQSLNQQIKTNDLSHLPENVCYSCLCTIEDINYFISNCRLSILRLKAIWENQWNSNFTVKNDFNCETCSNDDEKDINFELEFLIDEEKVSDIEKKDFEKIIILNNESTNELEICETKNLKNNSCKECLESFATLIELTAHSKMHSKFLCTKCGLNFFDRPSFSYHMKKHKKNLFKCNFCSKSFMTKYQLISHKWTHTGDGFENHECVQCGKKCRTQHELEIHMRFHTQIRSYKCDKCSKAFIVKAHLKQHMVTHTGIRNYICCTPGCNKSYTTVSSLKKHNDIHLPDSEKHIPCEYCPRKFSMNFILQDHIRKSHRKLLIESQIKFNSKS